MATRLGISSLAFAASVLLLPFLAPSAAGEDSERPMHVRGVVYEVFHGDSIHRMGFHVREVHLPERGFSFYVSGGGLRVIRTEPLRYAMEGDSIKMPDPDGEGEIELPVIVLPGLETRRIGETRVLAEHADQLQALLETKERLRVVAESYLLTESRYESVAAYTMSNEAAFTFVADLLDAAGILWVGVSNAGGETVSVPPSRAAEARAVLRSAIATGLHAAAHGGVEDPRLGFAILGSSGIPEWQEERTLVPPTPPGADVLMHLSRFPGSEIVTTHGERRRPQYGSFDLEQAEQVLSGQRARPWAPKTLMGWYATAEDEKVRAALVTLLAACRNKEALPLVGRALADESLDVRVAATYGILEWWDAEPGAEGGTEQAMEQAAAWWNAHRPAAGK